MRTPTARWAPLLALAATLAASAPARADVTLPTGGKVEAVDFERHVMGLLGRMGCASGSCHGSFQGKGGLMLSLFGYDPVKDYQALVRDANGRRIDRNDPDKSLLLQKATGALPHGGATRFGKSSWQYRLLRAWIAQGAKHTPGSGEVKSVRVSPAELAVKKAGETARLKVEATFKDGSTEDITALCDYRTNDDAIADVNNLGRVRALRPGDTALVVSFRGTVLPVRIMVPMEARPGFTYPRVPEVNFIDREVFAKLKRLNMVPSDLSGDAEFLRRVYLDTIGTLPTPEEARKFLADRSPDKRAKLIDELLAHPMHAALWATKFCDITGNNTDALENPPQRKPFYSQMWHDWFRKRLADNMPYDKIVRGVLTATSRQGKSADEYIREVEEAEEAQNKSARTKYAERETLDLFWRRQARVTTDVWGEKTAAAFLGVRLECAQCHKHPFDRWTQADYRAYANIFARVNFAIAPESAAKFRTANTERQKRSQQAINELRRKGEKVMIIPVAPLREVFLLPRPQPNQLLRHPDTNAPLAPRALGGPEVKAGLEDDPREALWKWMRDADNPFFARSFVNRAWGHYFGTGIVHPVDDFSLANPPSNPGLLDALAADFVASGYDIRKLERRILMSRTYQLSSTPNATNRLDKNNFARSYVRPLMAEVVVDMLNAALGTSERWAASEAADGARAIEVGASRVQNPNVNYVFRVFGRPPRTSACDCERAMDPALPQKLFLMSDPNLVAKLRLPANRANALLREEKDDLKVLEALFLAALSRYPTERDKKTFLDYRNSKHDEGAALTAGQRQALFADVTWALINTTEFIFNH